MIISYIYSTYMLSTETLEAYFNQASFPNLKIILVQINNNVTRNQLYLLLYVSTYLVLIKQQIISNQSTYNNNILNSV
uniref:Putative ovule protein n=1 Tax=Solanum chacoense TaxID=4108 RepID=A0A0V0GQ78_SOLCH